MREIERGDVSFPFAAAEAEARRFGATASECRLAIGPVRTLIDRLGASVDTSFHTWKGEGARSVHQATRQRLAWARQACAHLEDAAAAFDRAEREIRETIRREEKKAREAAERRETAERGRVGMH